MTEYRAAELPEGSVVATEDKAWIKFRCMVDALNWRATDGSRARDRTVDEALRLDEAEVLRVGAGREG